MCFGRIPGSGRMGVEEGEEGWSTSMGRVRQKWIAKPLRRASHQSEACWRLCQAQALSGYMRPLVVTYSAGSGW